MEDTSKKYTVSELANCLDVPRTTINDWLTRYSQYIDYKVQGKRKIYFESTLEVLKEISKLRESEISSFDIEEELAKRHPVHGEIASGNKDQIPSEEGVSQPPSEQNHLPDLHQEEFALITRQQTDEIAGLISEHLRHMAKRIEEIESVSQLNNNRATRWYVIAFALVLVLILTVFYGFRKFESLVNQNKKLSLSNQDFTYKLSKTNTQLATTLESNKKLLQESDQMGNQLKSLEANIKKQEDEFKSMLKREKEQLSQEKKAELLQLRDEFAKTKLDFLKRLEVSIKNAKEKETQMESLQKQAQDQSQVIKKLAQQNKLEAFEKRMLSQMQTLIEKSQSAGDKVQPKKRSGLLEKTPPSGQNQEETGKTKAKDPEPVTVGKDPNAKKQVTPVTNVTKENKTSDQ